MTSVGRGRDPTIVSSDVQRDASNLSLMAQPKRANELHS
jgi:hypothetical protein